MYVRCIHIRFFHLSCCLCLFEKETYSIALSENSTLQQSLPDACTSLLHKCDAVRCVWQTRTAIGTVHLTVRPQSMYSTVRLHFCAVLRSASDAVVASRHSFFYFDQLLCFPRHCTCKVALLAQPDADFASSRSRLFAEVF